jgi:hypothetical protein
MTKIVNFANEKVPFLEKKVIFVGINAGNTFLVLTRKKK